MPPASPPSSNTAATSDLKRHSHVLTDGPNRAPTRQPPRGVMSKYAATVSSAARGAVTC